MFHLRPSLRPRHWRVRGLGRVTDRPPRSRFRLGDTAGAGRQGREEWGAPRGIMFSGGGESASRPVPQVEEAQRGLSNQNTRLI